MPQHQASLKRVLSLPAMVFYGLGTIVGAGIYVLIGQISGLAGAWAPVSFLLAAIIAGFTGLSYAELVARHPRSAGEAVYVEQAFNKPWLTQLVGWAVVFTGLVSASTLLKGFAGYFMYLLGGHETLIIVVTTVALCGLACMGVRESVGVAVTITLLELLGLVLVIAVSANSLGDLDQWQQWQEKLHSPSWRGIAAAAFLAFYAFIGFEDMVNMAEEVKDVALTLPKAIVIALITATIIYALIAMVAVIAFEPQALAASKAPLATMTEDSTWLSPQILAAISLIAIVNGVIVQLLMAPRVIYGISARSRYLKCLSMINARTQTPINATLLAAATVLLFALLLPLTVLAKMTSAIILCLFVLINAALIVLKRRDPFAGFQVVAWVPALGLITSLLLLMSPLYLR